VGRPRCLCLRVEDPTLLRHGGNYRDVLTPYLWARTPHCFCLNCGPWTYSGNRAESGCQFLWTLLSSQVHPDQSRPRAQAYSSRTRANPHHRFISANLSSRLSHLHQVRLDQDEEQLDSAGPPLRPQWPTRQTVLAPSSECDNVICTGPLI
jgi:hypothetical protein